MKRIVMPLLALVLVSLSAGAAAAGPWTPRIDRREARQHARIHQGVRSGELTRGEAARLRAGQRRVHRLEHIAKRDGSVSRGEQRRIERAQDRQSRVIHRLKHNGRERS